MIIRADTPPPFWSDAERPESERDIKADALVRLNLIPGVWAANHPTGVGLTLDGARVIRYGIEGSGDILASLAGRLAWFETKTATGRQSDAQRRFESAMRRLGIIYELVRSAEEAEERARYHLERSGS